MCFVQWAYKPQGCELIVSACVHVLQLGTHLRGKRKREEMANLSRRMRK